jgi:hypothetical protein
LAIDSRLPFSRTGKHRPIRSRGAQQLRTEEAGSRRYAARLFVLRRVCIDGKQFPGPSSPRLELIFRKQDIVETELP